MERIILLNDITTWNRIGMSRYAGPYVIATRLRALGYDVQVFDWFTQHPDALELLETMINRQTIAVCLSTTFLVEDPYHDMSAEQIAELINRRGRQVSADAHKASPLWHDSEQACAHWFRCLKGWLQHSGAPDAKVILGGARVGQLFMYKPERLEQLLPGVDYALIGAADDSIVHLFADIKHGRVPYSVQRGNIRFIKPMVRNICPAIEFSAADLIQPGEALPIELKRGCAFNCKFCHYEKRGATMKDPTVLRDELLRNYERFGTTLYTFSDDCFNDTRPNVESVCNTLANLPFKIEWVSYARADLAIKFPDTLAAMVQTGARGLFFGIETFNYEAGRAAGKGVPPDRVKQFLLDTMARYGKQTLIQCSFISGLPHETDESMAETIAWLDQHRPMHLFGCSPLGLYEYHEDLDETAIDYADYAKNPGKYGLEEVRHHPDVYWRHATMDLPRAREWAQTATQTWFGPTKPKPLFRSMWWYPSYRMLGLSHERIMNGLLDMNGWGGNQDVRERWKSFSTKYWNELANSTATR